MAAKTTFQSATGILGVSALALFGLSACEDNGVGEPAEDDGVEVEDNGADNGGVEDTDNGMDDGADDDAMDEDNGDTDEDGMFDEDDEEDDAGDL